MAEPKQNTYPFTNFRTEVRYSRRFETGPAKNIDLRILPRGPRGVTGPPGSSRLSPVHFWLLTLIFAGDIGPPGDRGPQVRMSLAM